LVKHQAYDVLRSTSAQQYGGWDCNGVVTCLANRKSDGIVHRNLHMYKVTYSNGVIQELELISQSEFNELKRIEALIFESKKNQHLMTPRLTQIKNGLKAGKIFTDESPIYQSINNCGNIFLPHGVFKCVIEKLN
jgi:hypothetical protein